MIFISRPISCYFWRLCSNQPKEFQRHQTPAPLSRVILRSEGVVSYAINNCAAISASRSADCSDTSYYLAQGEMSRFAGVGGFQVSPDSTA